MIVVKGIKGIRGKAKVRNSGEIGPKFGPKKGPTLGQIRLILSILNIQSMPKS